jgi:hypothetical protein
MSHNLSLTIFSGEHGKMTKGTPADFEAVVMKKASASKITILRAVKTLGKKKSTAGAGAEVRSATIVM